ncbi:MAG: purine-binding chemotaxis protein CheW [Ignavibacteriales bacterium]|nr:purine-binding chemotaxis protein CheW [Ignavibacteriales bacterium]
MNGKPHSEIIDRNRNVDWAKIHRRLEAVRERLSSGWNPSPEKTAEILRARATELAQEPKADVPEEGSLEIAEFLLANERYGIETAFVREVYPLRELTPLPGTPAFVLGIINVRGRILSVLDLKKFFGLPEKGLTDLNKVIVARSPAMEIGILADTILGVKKIRRESIQPPLPTLVGIREQYLRGITSDHGIILDAGKLLSDKNLVVHEEIDIV